MAVRSFVLLLGTCISLFVSLLPKAHGVSVSSYFTAVKLNYFKSYGSLQLLSFEVPCDTWYLTVFLQPGKTAAECADKAVYSILSPYGFPLVDFTEYPKEFLTGPQLTTQIPFNMSTSVFELRSEILKPRCGTWYLGLVLRDSFDEGSVITNKDLKKSCYYFVGGGFTSELVVDVPILNIFSANEIIIDTQKQSPYPIIDGELKLVGFYKFRPAPNVVTRFSVSVTRCQQNISGNWTDLTERCPIDFASRVSAPPSTHTFSDNIFVSCRFSPLSECVLPLWPVWSSDSFSWHYLAIWANESEANLKLQLKFEYNECETLEAAIPKHQLANVLFGQENSSSLVANGHLVNDNLVDDNSTSSSNSSSNNTALLAPILPSAVLKQQPIAIFRNKKSSQCSVAPEMTRLLVVTQNMYTPIYFMSDSTGLLGNRMPLLAGQLVIIPLKVDSKFDNGGTMRLRVFLDLHKSNQEMALKVCLQWRHVPMFQDNRTSSLIRSPCPFGYYQTISAKNSSNATDLVAIPYPKQGTWFLSLYGQCRQGYNCTGKSIYVSFELYSTRCADAAPNQCGEFGTCNEYSPLAGKVSACSCFAGYRGYGCTDARQAIPDAYARTLYVTLSNLAFLPSIFVAINWGHFVPAAVYFYNMFFSSFYHWCDSDLYSWCMTKSDALQFADFLGSVASFWTTLITMARIGHHARLFAHVVGLLMISFATSLDRFSLWTFLAPFLVSVVIMSVSWIFRSVRNKRVYPPRIDLYRLIPGIILVAAALAIYTFLETPENYEYTHGTWHILIMMATLFLLPRPITGNSCYPNSCGYGIKGSKNDPANEQVPLFPLLDRSFWRTVGRGHFWRSHVNTCCDWPESDETGRISNTETCFTNVQGSHDDNSGNISSSTIATDMPRQNGQEMRVSPSGSPTSNLSNNSSSATIVRGGGAFNASTSSMTGLLDRHRTNISRSAGDVANRVSGGRSDSPTVTFRTVDESDSTYSHL